MTRPGEASWAPALQPLIRKLERLGPLSVEARRTLANQAVVTRQVEAGRDLLPQGERSTACILLLDGFACRYRTVPDGSRQILSFCIPGDICDLHNLLLGSTDHSIGTLTEAKVALIPRAAVRDWTRRHSDLSQLLWRDTLLDSAVFREWIVNVGRRSAYQRVAHLLCEVATRLRAASLLEGSLPEGGLLESGVLPLTRRELADATGLPGVHINRSLQTLLDEGLIAQTGEFLEILDWEGLKQAADFDPAYLQPLSVAAA